MVHEVFEVTVIVCSDVSSASSDMDGGLTLHTIGVANCLTVTVSLPLILPVTVIVALLSSVEVFSEDAVIVTVSLPLPEFFDTLAHEGTPDMVHP